MKKNNFLINIVTNCWTSWLCIIFLRLLKPSLINRVSVLYDKYNLDHPLLSKRKVINDVLKSILVYDIKPEEYFRYDFLSKSSYSRALIVGEKRRMKCFRDIVNNNEAWKLYTNKYATYKKFSNYYHREVIEINGVEDRDLFINFANHHSRFIVKPVNNYSGKGIFVVDLLKEKRSLEDIFSDIVMVGHSVIEECIVQSSTMASFHSNSVNTIRFVTFYNNGKLNMMFALLRMGQGGNFVDNAGAGGICASVDLQTGLITTPGRDYIGNTYFYHPDSKTQILGNKIPQWESLLELIDELVTVYPEQKWTGWDLCHTEAGWIVVEANHSPSFTGIQTSRNSGIANVIEPILNDLGLSYFHD